MMHENGKLTRGRVKITFRPFSHGHFSKLLLLLFIRMVLWAENVAFFFFTCGSSGCSTSSTHISLVVSTTALFHILCMEIYSSVDLLPSTTFLVNKTWKRSVEGKKEKYLLKLYIQCHNHDNNHLPSTGFLPFLSIRKIVNPKWKT